MMMTTSDMDKVPSVLFEFGDNLPTGHTSIIHTTHTMSNSFGMSLAIVFVYLTANRICLTFSSFSFYLVKLLSCDGRTKRHNFNP